MYVISYKMLLRILWKFLSVSRLSLFSLESVLLVQLTPFFGSVSPQVFDDSGYSFILGMQGWGD